MGRKLALAGFMAVLWSFLWRAVVIKTHAPGDVACGGWIAGLLVVGYFAYAVLRLDPLASSLAAIAAHVSMVSLVLVYAGMVSIKMKYIPLEASTQFIGLFAAWYAVELIQEAGQVTESKLMLILSTYAPPVVLLLIGWRYFRKKPVPT